MAGIATVAGATIGMSIDPGDVEVGGSVKFQCTADSTWEGALSSAKIFITNSQGVDLVQRGEMEISGLTATFNYEIPSNEDGGTWSYSCQIRQKGNRDSQTEAFVVAVASDSGSDNSPPVAVDDSASTPFGTEVTIDVLENDTDVDGNLVADSVTITNGPTVGNAQHVADGIVIYTPESGISGEATFDYQVCDDAGLCDTGTVTVTVAAEKPPVDEPPIVGMTGHIPAHNTIEEYNGPATCIACHQDEAQAMLDSLHMKWAGPTPDLTNTNGEELGKGKGGINTFCTYAPSSKGACYSCHVRADGNAPHPPEVTDVDCLMCHSDSYERTFVTDQNNTEIGVNVDGEPKTYVFGEVDTEGNYTTVPDYDKMTINVVDAARTVHMPTTNSCLRCHAKAGGGDWTKRGDMGLNSSSATVQEDVHLAKDGADLSCVNCHSALDHKITGRGIDLRQTVAEAPTPTCSACHTEAPHNDSTLNRHAGGQVSCQVCHIREYAKGGATEISRDWLSPTWNPSFCSGQGGWVGHELKESNVKPEYVWFDGTSYVYNVGETIDVDTDTDGNDILHMARANGQPFDGKSKIVPIKRHFTNTPLDANGKIIPPAIMWMFMTGDFDEAVKKGLEEQDPEGKLYTGNYTMVNADAEMLITHGVEPKSNAPSCSDCHNGSGSTPDDIGMVPFDALGYHEVPASVQSCTLCHDQKSLSWESTHKKHRTDVSCSSCHTPEPTGVKQGICSSCHGSKSWYSEGHKKHVKEKGYDCVTCHTFS